MTLSEKVLINKTNFHVVFQEAFNKMMTIRVPINFCKVVRENFGQNWGKITQHLDMCLTLICSIYYKSLFSHNSYGKINALQWHLSREQLEGFQINALHFCNQTLALCWQMSGTIPPNKILSDCFAK